METKKITIMEEHINKYKNAHDLENYFQDELFFPPCITMKKHKVSEVFGDFHHHDLYEILYIVEGKVLYAVEEKIYELEKGDIILISPTTLHQLKKIVDNKSSRIVVNFTENFVKSFSTKNTDLLKVFNLIDKTGIHKLTLPPPYNKYIEDNLNKMANLMFEKEYGSDVSYNLRFIQTLLLINNIYLNIIESENYFLPIVNPIISKSVEYINNNISSKITIEDIAKYVALSPSRLSHIFKEITGISILRFIIKKRLILAKDLLRKGESLMNVSQMCGFQDHTSFFRTFRKEYNITPKAYSKQYNN